MFGNIIKTPDTGRDKKAKSTETYFHFIFYLLVIRLRDGPVNVH